MTMSDDRNDNVHNPENPVEENSSEESYSPHFPHFTLSQPQTPENSELPPDDDEDGEEESQPLNSLADEVDLGVVFATCGANGNPNGYNTLVGKPVSEAVEMLQEELNFEPGTLPKMDGEDIPMDYVLQDGDRIAFPKRGGTLG